LQKGAKMKKIIILILTIFVFAQISFAHPPSKVEVTYDAMSEMLEINIIHEVDDPATHFIEKVIVELDGVNIIETKLFIQDDKEGLLLTYRIPDVSRGSIITIKAECNTSGSLVEKIAVE
jgi:hypothetical protein